ncbi:MAG TPA: hypothetical protein VGG25_05295 [Streptosporangiaceae bacterium]|jgi:hypothetical protein
MLDGAPPGAPGAGWPAADAIVRLPGGITDWLARRSVAATSVTGVSLALAIAAGVWLSAGTRPANLKGAVLVGAGYLAARAARQLAGLDAREGWLGALGRCCCDGAVLAGLAVGAGAQGWLAMWPLAISVLALIAVRETMTACAGPDGAADGDGPVRRVVDTVLAMPSGGRVLLVVAAVPLWGARATLLALLDWGIIAVGYGIGSGTIWRRDRDPEPDLPAARDPQSASLAVLLHRADADPPPGPAAPDELDEVAEPSAAGTMEPAGGAVTLGPAAALVPATLRLSVAPQPLVPDGAAPGEADDPERPPVAMVLRCRDDGAIARWIGRLANGQLMPLPPALLALTAVAVLAHLGMNDLPGLLIVAPAIVMLLAAPGASHPHDGRLDWLAPVLPLGAQFLYITALGAAARVPAGITFALCAAVTLHYADVSCAGVPAQLTGPPASPRGTEPGSRMRAALASGTWLGWDGRMVACGLGAAMGITLFAYVVLAAYLGALICWKVLTSSIVLREGDRR